MRIGVFPGRYTPETGGGYTFPSQVVNMLLRIAGESPHKFVVLGDPAGNIGIPENLSFKRLRPSRWRKLRFALARKSLLPKGVITRNGIRHQVLYAEGEIILSMGFDMLWSLVPHTPTMEIPYLITLWDLQHRINPAFPEVSTDGNWAFREQSMATALRRAMGIVTGTTQGKRDATFYYQIPEERFVVNPFPAPETIAPQSLAFLSTILKKYELTPPFLFYPAQLWAHKNHVRLLEGAQLLRDKWNLPFQVVLSGAAHHNYAHLLNTAERLGISKEVRHLGFVSREDLFALYQSAFALVFPSFCGPDNLPPLEAFASGCPVVASDIPGAREQLGDAAIFFDAWSSNELAKAVASLHKNVQLRQELVERGYAVARSRTAEQYVRRIFKTLDTFAVMRRCWC